MSQFYSQKQNDSRNRKLAILNIIDLDHFGQGIAKHNGKTIFVPNVLPGESVEAAIDDNENKQYAYAKVIRRLSDSTHRVEPVCRHFLQCGGCQQQHAHIELQRESKVKALLNLLKSETGITLPVKQPIFADEYHYLRRARFGLQYLNEQKQLIVGFRKTASNDLLMIKECPVLCDELERLITPATECLSELKRVHRLGHLELILADNGPVLVLRHIGPLPDEDMILLRRFSSQNATSIYLIGQEWQGMLVGEDPYYLLGNLKLYFNPHGFIQDNSEVNKIMVNQVTEWLDIQPTDRVLDLFCGIGNFSLPLALQATEVIGVDGVLESREQAKYNGIVNNIKNVQFYDADLTKDFINEAWIENGFDKILLKPFRTGAYEIMPTLSKLRASRIAYVSCNAATLARDSKVLISAGYHIADIKLLDMFPQTNSLESVTLFIKS